MNDTECLSKLKEGDRVYIKHSAFGTAELNLTTVKKVTPKGHIRTENDQLFRNGTCKTGTWSWVDLVEWTVELEKELFEKEQLQAMIAKIKSFDMRNIKPEKVKEIYGILFPEV